LEHIEEWLHHHGEPDGSKTHERVSEALKSARSGGAETGHFENEAIEERELRTTYFYESLLHHGRAGFLWQKLRQPRSYDYEKTETKGYDERLRMPKFPFSEEDIEAIATFVLGLVAEPPSDEYLYQPQGPALARIEGERLLEKYNCAGCHMLDMPRVRYGENLKQLVGATRQEMVDWFLEHKQELLAGRPVERPAGVQLLLKNAADLLDDPVDVRQLAEWADKNPNRDKLQKWLDEHEEELIASELKGGEHPKGLKLLLQLKPPRNAETGETMTMDVDGKLIVLPVLSFDGLVNSKPDPEDPPEDQEYTFDLWGSLRAGGKLMRPGKKMIVPFQSLVEIKPARGGAYAEWLVEWMMKSSTEVNRSQAWQMVPPPLYKEGIKVQTSWLYRFLRDPGRLRHTTVLRMPRFNMSSEEARTLANYFPAVDGAAYPYQHIPEREPQYLARKNQELKSVLHAKQTGYLAESWKLLNAPLCISCHSVGGRQVQVTDPKKDIRGPNLEHASDRLRPDWMLLWLYKPAWITPYTSMPVTLPRGQTQFKELFQGDAGVQTTALRDALMNYKPLMEQEGKTVYQPKTAAAGDGKGN
jgi:mono/diheme cytochrome c family protein